MDSRTRRTHNLTKDEAAEVGIGTMIVFIAAILVAAIAAGVLINTAQKLQSKSQQTGTEASQNVASALTVMRVDGLRSDDAANDPIDQLDLTVQLAAGADPVDLSKLAILLDDGQGQVQLVSCASGGEVADEDAEFATDVLRGSATDCGVMTAGDLVQIHLGLADTATPANALPVAGGIETATKVTVSLIPAHGSSAVVSFTSPDGFGDSLLIGLF
ncbi:MAG: archaeal flagellin FlaB [Thermoplasmata archaeon]|jgi:flagellin FlaB|nr:archaeal flagellin FlaB [Thermoplasmata archaeon]